MYNPIIFKDSDLVVGIEDYCLKSNRTVDIHFNDLATNEALLDTLGFISMYANDLHPKPITFLRAYFGSFSSDNPELLAQLDTNPIIRLLIQNETMLENVQKHLNK